MSHISCGRSALPQWDPIAHMNRCAALKPGSGGKLQKRTAKPRPVPQKGSWERLASVTRARWDCAKGEAIESFLWAIRGDSLDTFVSVDGVEIPF